MKLDLKFLKVGRWLLEVEFAAPVPFVVVIHKTTGPKAGLTNNSPDKPRRRRFNYAVVWLAFTSLRAPLALNQHGALPLGRTVWPAPIWCTRLIFPAQLRTNRTSVTSLQLSLDKATSFRCQRNTDERPSCFHINEQNWRIQIRKTFRRAPTSA